MSGLFGSLGIAARALEAQRTGLDVVGQNMANVNTAGYSRREVDFAEVPPYERFGAGNGVEVEGIRAVRDMLLERRYRQELPTQSRASAIADQLAVVETALGKPGESIDKKLTAFFDSFSSTGAGSRRQRPPGSRSSCRPSRWRRHSTICRAASTALSAAPTRALSEPSIRPTVW